jgi:DNA polymerase-3 subunit delta'
MNGGPGGEALTPWHAGCWEMLQRARSRGALHHALLFTGSRGLGKRQLAGLLARSLLCPRPEPGGFPCGKCADCRLVQAKTHPDYIEIGPDPESKSNEIRVDAVRRLSEADALTSHRGGYKVVVIDPAQQMNLSAANSLLKTLEEPAPGTLVLLVCERPERLPATIRSRCATVMVPIPAESVASEWLRRRLPDQDTRILLNLAHGAPLRALEIATDDLVSRRDRTFGGFAAVARGERDPIREAAAWNREEPKILLEWLCDWIGDILRLASGHPAPRLVNADKADALGWLAARVAPRDGHLLLRDVLGARAAEESNLNTLLMFESILVDWAGIVRS